VTNDVAHSSCLKPIALHVWLAASSCCKRSVWLHMVWGWKCLPSNHHSTRRTIVFMHQLITRSDTSIPAVCYACLLLCPVSVAVSQVVWLKWYLSTLRWRWTASIAAMSCCLSRCFQQSNVSQNVVSSQSNNVAYGEIGRFLCSVISQGKVVALDRWGGKWNHLSMPPIDWLTTPKIIVIGHLLLKLL